METAGAAPHGHVHRLADGEDPPRELSGLRWGVLVSLGLIAVVAVARLLVALELRSTAGDEGNVIGAYDTYTTFAGLYALLFIIAAGVFIAWFFQAYKNLRRLGVHNMRYGTGWAIGAWFIPIFGMIRPKQITNDVWRGSERGVDVSTQWRQVAVPSFVHWWWGLFLLHNVLVEKARSMLSSGRDKLTFFSSYDSGLSEIESGALVDIFGAVCTIAAVILAMVVVSRISERLDGIRSEVLGCD
jgi:hypothetical protein